MDDFTHLYDDTYAAAHDARARVDDRIERLLPYVDVDRTDVVADFGCGTGALATHIAPQVGRYVGVDFSESMIRRAQENISRTSIENAEFVAGSIVDLCRARSSIFTVGFALDVSEHVANDEWLEILKEIHTALCSGGKLYLHTPNAEFFLEMMKARNILLEQFPGHIAVRTADENAQLLNEAGFRSIEVSFLPHYNVLKYMHPFSHLPYLGRFLKARLFIVALK